MFPATFRGLSCLYHFSQNGNWLCPWSLNFRNTVCYADCVDSFISVHMIPRSPFFLENCKMNLSSIKPNLVILSSSRSLRFSTRRELLPALDYHRQVRKILADPCLEKPSLERA